jgi:hypothetical protein
MGLLLAAAACGPAEVVVTMEIETPNPEGEGTTTRTLSDIEVQLLPYDRDQIFDSVSTAFGTPEPPIPSELIAAREEVQQAQQEWDQNQRRWNILRDTLQTLTSAMEQFSRGEARYVALFREWQDFDAELGRVERQMNASFDRFDSLQRGTIRASDSVRILRDNWADEAFQDVGQIFLAKQRETGLDIAVDTTDASGVARGNLAVKPGQYWVYARYDLGYTELYWNVPITVERGEPVMVQLTLANAEERPKL